MSGAWPWLVRAKSSGLLLPAGTFFVQRLGGREGASGILLLLLRLEEGGSDFRAPTFWPWWVSRHVRSGGTLPPRVDIFVLLRSSEAMPFWIPGWFVVWGGGRRTRDDRVFFFALREGKIGSQRVQSRPPRFFFCPRSLLPSPSWPRLPWACVDFLFCIWVLIVILDRPEGGRIEMKDPTGD